MRFLLLRSCSFFLLLAAIAMTGCGSSNPQIVPVSGTVKYPDGTVPTGEIAIVQFVSAADRTEGAMALKPASGDIKPDGSFTLTTSKQGDGAFEGDYKVTFTVVRKYGTQDHLIDLKYTKNETTPHTAKVERGKSNHFDFVIEKAAGK